MISLQVLTKKKTLEGHIKINVPRPSRPSKITGNLKLDLKIFCLKHKTNQILTAIIEKNQILSLQENSLMFFQTIASSFV